MKLVLETLAVVLEEGDVLAKPAVDAIQLLVLKLGDLVESSQLFILFGVLFEGINQRLHLILNVSVFVHEIQQSGGCFIARVKARSLLFIHSIYFIFLLSHK
jgi:hypothetical protein